MRSNISSLQSVMDAIQKEHGDEATRYILNQCNDQADAELAAVMNTSTVRLLTSDSDSMSNSESNQASDDDSIKIEAV